MPQDMSRAFLMTLERLAFITVLVISRMIDSIRLDSTDSRIGSKLSARTGAALAGWALTLVAELICAGSSRVSDMVGIRLFAADAGCPSPAPPCRIPSIALAVRARGLPRGRDAMHRDQSLSMW